MIDRCCISLNNACNLKCKYCHFHDKQVSSSSFEQTDIFVIADYIHIYCKNKGINAFKLGIVGSGEPMLKKELIFDLLEYVCAQNYTELNMYTITNGTLLSASDIEKFYNYRKLINVCFSLDGFEYIHNYGRAKFADVMNCIEIYKSIFGVSPTINATVTALSLKYKEKLIKFFKTNNLLNVSFSKLVGYYDKDLYISEKEFADFMQYVKSMELSCRQFNTVQKYDCTMYGKLCGVGRTNIFITPEGVYPCGRFYKNNKYLLGNYKDTLFEIERTMSALTPVENGKCYYLQYVEDKK